MEKNSPRWAMEKQECAQALLNRPWVTKAADPDLFRAIRSHYEELRDWFQEHCGFTLLITRHFARLEKVPGRVQPWMGFSEFNDPRDYALFTYGLWYLEGKGEGEQFLLTEMVTAIREHLLGSDVELDWTLYDHRLAMVRALKRLQEMGILQAVDGDEMEWVRSGGDQNVLYESSPLGRYVLRRFPRDLTTYKSIEELGEGLYADTPEGQLLRRKHYIYRRLVQEPVVYDREWSPEELYYVLTQRRSLLEQLGNMLGLEGRRYREGLIFFYPETTGEMQLFPTARTLSDIALLLAGQVRRLLGQEGSHLYVDEQGRLRLTRADLEGLVLDLRERYKDYWSQQYRRTRSGELAAVLLAHLEEWGLAGRGPGDEIWLEPALARWSGSYDGPDMEGDAS